MSRNRISESIEMMRALSVVYVGIGYVSSSGDGSANRALLEFTCYMQQCREVGV